MAIIEGLFKQLDSEAIQKGNSEVTRLKILYCESLFERFGTDSESAESFSYICTNKYLSSFYNRQFSKYYDLLVNKYPTKYTRRNFMAECISYTYEAIIGFEILDGGNWQGIIDGTDKKNTKRLVKHIIRTVSFNILRNIVNEDKLYTRREINGKKEQHVTISLNVVSLDNITIGYDGEETTYEKMVSNEQNFIYEREGICWHFYLDWLNKNKARLLSKIQLKYLETGVYERKMHNRIVERITTALELENPFGKKTVLQLQKEEEIALWTGLIDIIYNENYDYSVQNQRISKWIVEHLDDDRVSNLIFDSLGASDSTNVVKAYRDNGFTIPSDTLYKINEAVERKLDQLQLMEVQSVKFYKKESEFGIGHWTKEKHEEYAKRLKKFKSENSKKVASNRLVVTPTGLEISKEIE